MTREQLGKCVEELDGAKSHEASSCIITLCGQSRYMFEGLVLRDGALRSSRRRIDRGESEAVERYA